jgi:hypothetical protein
MKNASSKRISTIFFYGLILGIITSFIPFLLWQKMALNQGRELLIDIFIILFITIGSWFCINKTTNIFIALVELIIVVLISSILTAVTVLILDRYNFEPITFKILLRGIPASLIFGMPSFVLIALLKFFQNYRKGKITKTG